MEQQHLVLTLLRRTLQKVQQLDVRWTLPQHH
jgi:hypothetical protein